MTRKLKRALVAVGIVGVMSLAAARAEELAAAPAAKDWSVTTSADFVSKYVWRGLLLNEDPAIQPSVTGTWKGLSLSVWSSLDTTDYSQSIYGNTGESREWDFSEVDYVLTYTHTIDRFTLTGGYAYYQYPRTPFNATQEVSAKVVVNDTLPWGLVPSLAGYYEVDQVNGLYFNAGLLKSIEISKDRVTLDLSTGFGWGNAQNNKYYYYGTDESGFLDASATAMLNFKVTSAFVVSPFVTYSEIVDHEIATNVDDGLNSGAGSTASGSAQTVVGLRVSYSF